jgi:hypothetical protein
LASGDPSATRSSPISRYLHRYPRGNAPQIAIRRVQNGGMLTVVGKNYVAPAPLTFQELCLEIEWTAAFLVHFIGAWPGGGTLADAQDDQSLLHGVQRQMEIICAAVERLAEIDAGIAQRITDYGKLVAFRRLQVHGFANLSANLSEMLSFDQRLWRFIENRLPLLRKEIAEIGLRAAVPTNKS